MEAGAGAYEFNNWNHLALTCDGTVYSLYYNGELVAQETFAEMDLDTNPLHADRLRIQQRRHRPV